ncbi:MAG TPA: SDR family NAD(P)-dependent oxidoreductase [Thermomicrobiales bacterium]
MDGAGSLSGQVAIVTGAGSGVGRAVALALAAEGMTPALVGRRRDALEATAAAIQERGGKALVAPGDVADEVVVGETVEQVLDEFGRIDSLICCAGIGLYGRVEGYPLAAWQQTMATNLTGVFLYCRAVIGPMRERGRGSIISIASGAGKQGYPELAAYSASKFGLIGFMQSLAAEVGEHGIKVSTIVPGSILTEFGGRTIEEKQAAMAAGRRYLQPEDVADAVLFLLRQPDRAWTQELNLWPF